ncbi:RIKEN cDNA A730036I17 [Mus musculus]|nr:RIKEN cDNA A730036I17 [Mus musculus]
MKVIFFYLTSCLSPGKLSVGLHVFNLTSILRLKSAWEQRAVGKSHHPEEKIKALQILRKPLEVTVCTRGNMSPRGGGSTRRHSTGTPVRRRQGVGYRSDDFVRACVSITSQKAKATSRELRVYFHNPFQRKACSLRRSRGHNGYREGFSVCGERGAST